jgi:hypothetical protein
MESIKKLKDLKMWLHWLTISTIVLGILQLIFKGDMFNIKNIIISTPLIAVGDLGSEWLLRLIGIEVD